jgi:hypothetical protein
VSVYSCGGVYPWAATLGGVKGPASKEEWRSFIDELRSEMKLPPHPHLLSNRIIEVFLPVIGPPEATEAAAWPR